MHEHRLTAPAAEDVSLVLAWSHRYFGRQGRQSYRALISAAIRDVVHQPEHLASKRHQGYGSGVRSWHLRLSRTHVSPDVGRVQFPRHVLFYRVMSGEVVIGRLLHERMDLRGYLSPRIWRL